MDSLPRFRNGKFLCAVALGLAVRTMHAQTACPGRSLTAELFTGSAWNLPLPLVVHLPEGRTVLAARYSTRPFADAPYYSYRVGRRRPDGAGMEVALLHHKLYLDNPAPPVERFEMTHGYNLPTVDVVGPGQGWQLRIGVGLVVAHPEGRIAGQQISGPRTVLGGGYHVAGITTQLAGGRRYALGRGQTALTAAPEAKLTASWARIRFDRGSVLAPNVALHVLGGLGVRRCG
jgi:hypothetical protein